MSQDSFLLLSSLLGGRDPNQVWASIKTDEPEPAASADLEAAIAIRGRSCMVRGTTHVGTVVGPNLATSGMYPGSRYPVLVKVQTEKGEETFPYPLEQVVVLPLQQGV